MRLRVCGCEREYVWCGVVCCVLHHTALHHTISFGDIHNVPTQSKLALFGGFAKFRSDMQKCRPLGGYM